MSRNNRKQYTVLSAAFCGVGVAMACYAIGAALISYCALRELLGQQGSGGSVVMATVLSVMMGGWIATSAAGEKKIIACTLSGVIVLLIVLSAALLLEGQFVSMVSTAIAISVGTMLACVLCMKRQKKQPYRKSAYR